MIRGIKINKSRFYLGIAKRLIEHFYPLTNDPKILLAAVENLNYSIKHKMAEILDSRGIKHKEDHDGIMNLFSSIDVPKKDLKLISELWELSYLHSVSQVEFSRKGEYIICTNEYDIRKISIDIMKKYLSRVAIFVDRDEPKRILR